MEKIKAAVLIAMQQMPLLNGAICGPSAEVSFTCSFESYSKLP